MTTPEPSSPRDGGHIVDWSRTARRLRRSAVVAAGVGATGWTVSAVAGGPGLGTWLGIALGLIFVAELVIVGGSALRGMLRAGERGERLARSDVGLLPPRLGGRDRRGGV
ncbi:MAG: hypothetical protein KY469_03570 [Actinobacteria bacterium]|nr:hypothetical protein [Actinomycetota bacterium]